MSAALISGPGIVQDVAAAVHHAHEEPAVGVVAGCPARHYVLGLREREAACAEVVGLYERGMLNRHELQAEAVYTQRIVEGCGVRALIAVLREIGGAAC